MKYYPQFSLVNGCESQDIPKERTRIHWARKPPFQFLHRKILTVYVSLRMSAVQKPQTFQNLFSVASQRTAVSNLLPKVLLLSRFHVEVLFSTIIFTWKRENFFPVVTISHPSAERICSSSTQCTFSDKKQQIVIGLTRKHFVIPTHFLKQKALK